MNWCPGLGTVLANEEVTADGRSERGNFPVFRRNLKQWMMRITAYADRLVADLDRLDWPDSVKSMQRNWIGRSEGAQVRFPVVGVETPIEVFTTRPDTLFGATYMVLAPEHPLVDAITPEQWPAGVDARWTGGAATPREAVAAYRDAASRKSELDRQENREKTGVFTGAYATNPVNGEQIPVFVADYVLMGYGTGAIMAVPAQDQRDWDFATAFGLPIVRTVQPSEGWDGEAFTGDGPAINSANAEISLDGMGVTEAKRAITDWLAARGAGEAVVQYKLRDWLFSRQRYWGEPFPIVWDADGPIALPDDQLPVELPEIDDYSPKTYDPEDADTEPEPPLSRATDWVEVDLDLGAAAALPPRDEHDAAVGRLVLVLPALPGPGEPRAVRRPGGRAVLAGQGPVAAGRPRRRRPVRRRRGARGAAPAVRPVLAQGAVRPGPRQLRGAVPPAVQPGLHPGLRLHRRPRRVRAGRGGRRGRGRAFHVERPGRAPGVREDGQVAAQRGDARRDVRALRRRHLPPVRDVHRPDGGLPPVVHPRRRRLAAVPAAGVAQPGGRAHR